VAAVARFGSGAQDGNPRRFEQIIGNSAALESVLEQVERVAPTGSTVFIQGETGTGKELIAHAIHNLSGRCGRPFVKLNCAAIPFDLLESELFGHERGAFTGAIAQKIGRFELADKGTLFLDEVGDIPPGLQPKLLRVLQEQEFERLGSTRTHQVDVRLVAATNRNLPDMVKRNEFRSDLYYRLNVFPIPLPPLRERREDIPALVEHFVDIYARRMDKQIEHVPPETMSALVSYQWPGNIRELQNFIDRAVVLSPGPVLRPTLTELRRMTKQPTASAAQTFAEASRDHILEVLEQSRWMIGGRDGAAERLGLPRTTLIYKMRKLGIEPRRSQRRRAVPLEPAFTGTGAYAASAGR
jgi:formate hydrogenlyase transcriptional activator